MYNIIIIFLISYIDYAECTVNIEAIYSYILKFYGFFFFYYYYYYCYFRFILKSLRRTHLPFHFAATKLYVTENATLSRRTSS